MLSLIIKVFFVRVNMLTVVIKILFELFTRPYMKHSWNFFTISILKLIRDALFNRNFTELLGSVVVLLSFVSKVNI